MIPSTISTFAFDHRSRACIQTLVEHDGYQNLSEWLCNEKQQAAIFVNNVAEIQYTMSNHPTGSRYIVSPAFQAITTLAIDYQYIDNHAWTRQLTIFFLNFSHLQTLRCVLEMPVNVDGLLFTSTLRRVGKDEPFRARVPVEEMLKIIVSGAYLEKAHAWKKIVANMLDNVCSLETRLGVSTELVRWKEM